MIFLALLAGLFFTLLVTNIALYLTNKVFGYFNYQLTHIFYYVLSALIMIIAGLVISLCFISFLS